MWIHTTGGIDLPARQAVRVLGLDFAERVHDAIGVPLDGPTHMVWLSKAAGCRAWPRSASHLIKQSEMQVSRPYHPPTLPCCPPDVWVADKCEHKCEDQPNDADLNPAVGSKAHACEIRGTCHIVKLHWIHMSQEHVTASTSVAHLPHEVGPSCHVNREFRWPMSTTLVPDLCF